MDLFDDFDGLFSSLWNRYQRPVREVNAYSVYKSPGKGYIVVCNTLGIDKNDLTVNIEKEKGRPFPILKIKGQTKIEKINFANSVDLAIQLKLAEEITDVKYEMKNGLTIIYIAVTVEEVPKIEASYVENDSSSLDW